MRTKKEGRNEALGGLIPQLERLHDAKPDLEKRDVIWKAIEAAEGEMRKRAGGEMGGSGMVPESLENMATDVEHGKRKR